MIRKLMASISSYKFIDIGVNLGDPVFRGNYRGKQAHPDDLEQILTRAKNNGVQKMIVTVGQLEEAAEALQLCKEIQDDVYCTIGCHPTRCGEFEKSTNPEKYYQDLLMFALDNKEKVVAIGECGLDYDREHFCPRETQKVYFEKQLGLAKETKLPLFLHMRNACHDFIEIYKRHREDIVGGVAHCFTGTTSELKELLDLGLYIGITGCSLKTTENLETLKEVPADRLMIETDAPWCEVKNTHAGSKYVKTKFLSKKKEKWEQGLCVKSRNEPCHIVQVLEIIASVRGEDPVELANIIYQNTEKIFFSNK